MRTLPLDPSTLSLPTTADARSLASGPPTGEIRGQLAIRRPLLSWIASAAICSAIALVFTFAVVDYSRHNGRLRFYPLYDDVTYFVDGLQRLQTLQDRGLVAVVQGYFSHPPHSSYSTLLAMMSFALLGVQDWAPYLGNFVLVVLILTCADRIMSGARLWQKVATYLLVCTFPVTIGAVHDFRPDFASALFCGMGAVWTLRRQFLGSPARNSLVAGLLFGLALWSKTSTFPYTLVMFFGTLVLATVCDYLISGHEIRIVDAVKSWTLCIVATALVAGATYAASAETAVGYVHDTLFGANREIWDLRADFWTHIRFYLVGQGGRTMLNRHGFLVAALLTGSVVYVVRKRSRPTTLRAVALAAIVLLAYLVPTASPHKTAFFGLTFYFTLLCLTVHILRTLISKNSMSNSRWPIGSVTLVCTLAVGFAFWDWPATWDSEGSERVERRNAIAREIYDTVRPKDGQPSRVLLTTTGYINSDLFNYMSLKERASGVFYNQAMSGSIKDVQRELGRADFVVASESGNSEVQTKMPSAQIQDEVLGLLRSHQSYQLIRTVPTLNGKAYFIFSRRAGANPAAGEQR